MNGTPVTVVSNFDGNVRGVRTDELHVGDIVELHDGEIVPADLVLLTTQDNRGEAFVKTAQLDGETNLKPKLAVK